MQAAAADAAAAHADRMEIDASPDDEVFDGEFDDDDADITDEEMLSNLLYWKVKKPWVAGDIEKVIMTGRLPYVKWMHRNDAELTEKCFLIAARWGFFPILTWLHENNCPYDPKETMSRASLGGCLKAVKFLHKMKCPITPQMAEWAFNPDVAAWMKENINAPDDIDEIVNEEIVNEEIG